MFDHPMTAGLISTLEKHGLAMEPHGVSHGILEIVRLAVCPQERSTYENAGQ